MIKVQSNIKDLVPELNKKFSDAPAEDIVGYFLQAFKGRIALSSSLSIEDQTLTDIIVKIDKSARIFTLDTGRLFPETYQPTAASGNTYIRCSIFLPDCLPSSMAYGGAYSSCLGFRNMLLPSSWSFLRDIRFWRAASY
jgi:3'-phosphoadenosine 5'-phosphosulfate sulfotransferase (PAPS reductase)/FAD synthetase